MRFLADVFGVAVRRVYVWINEIADSLPEPEVGDDIQEIEIDEIWHYVSKNSKALGTQSSCSQQPQNYHLGYRRS